MTGRSYLWTLLKIFQFLTWGSNNKEWHYWTAFVILAMYTCARINLFSMYKCTIECPLYIQVGGCHVPPGNQVRRCHPLEWGVSDVLSTYCWATLACAQLRPHPFTEWGASPLASAPRDSLPFSVKPGMWLPQCHTTAINMLWAV